MRATLAVASLLPCAAYQLAIQPRPAVATPQCACRFTAPVMMGGKNAKFGLFAPLVLGAKAVMGEQDLNQLRAKVISAHSKVIANFVDTSESEFGQIALRKLFEAADTDGSGDLSREEVKSALKALGFSVDDRQVDGIVGRADV